MTWLFLGIGLWSAIAADHAITRQQGVAFVSAIILFAIAIAYGLGMRP